MSSSARRNSDLRALLWRSMCLQEFRESDDASPWYVISVRLYVCCCWVVMPSQSEYGTGSAFRRRGALPWPLWLQRGSMCMDSRPAAVCGTCWKKLHFAIVASQVCVLTILSRVLQVPRCVRMSCSQRGRSVGSRVGRCFQAATRGSVPAFCVAGSSQQRGGQDGANEHNLGDGARAASSR